MVIGAFPAAKLGLLAVRQVSKPVANIIKDRAKKSPIFRNYICIPPATMYNWLEVKTKMWALNLGRSVTVPPLNEATAIELGANLLGEFIIFAIGAGVLIFEYTRQTKNEYKKQEAMKREKLALITELAEMGFRLERQDAQIREVTRVLADLESRSIFSWKKEKKIKEYKPFDRNNPDQSPRDVDNTSSEYDPEDGLTFKALHYLETKVFNDATENDEDEEEVPEQSNFVEALSPTLSKEAAAEEESVEHKLDKSMEEVENELAKLKYAVQSESANAA